MNNTMNDTYTIVHAQTNTYKYYEIYMNENGNDVYMTINETKRNQNRETQLLSRSRSYDIM